MANLKLPQVIAHRGCAGYAPENTTPAIHTAADMGIQWVELDVKLTRDEVPIIFHDDTLERVTNGMGNVADTTLEEIKELDAGFMFSEDFTGVQIPTLEEAIDVLIERDLGLNLEIKPCEGREVLTAEIALDMMAQYWDNHQNILISSFSREALETAQELASDWARGFLMAEHLDADWRDFAAHTRATTVNINGNLITQSEVEDILSENYPIIAYTINNPERARELQNWGVSSFFSDVPDEITENILKVH